MVSNMKTNPNKSNVKKAPTANMLQVNLMRQKSQHQHEEFGSEDNPVINTNNFVDLRKSEDNEQPVSERTAWH